MSSVFPIEEEEMAFSPENQQWVRGEIDKALASLLPLARTRKLLYALRDWGLTAAIVMVPLALLAGVIALGIRVASDIGAEATFRAHTEDRLQMIEARLLNLSNGVPPRTALHEISSFQPKALSEALPALRRATEQPVGGLSPEIVQAIGRNLAQVNQRLPEYWPAAFQLAHFATSALNPDVPPPGPPWFAYMAGKDATFQGKHEKGAFYFGGSATIKDSVFVKCRIVVEADAVIRIENTVFIDCVFDFPPNAEHVPSMQLIARSLLESGFSRVSVPSS